MSGRMLVPSVEHPRRLVPLGNIAADQDGRYDGAAGSDEFADELWSYDPLRQIDARKPRYAGEERTALFTYFEPPHELSPSADLRDRLLDAASTAKPYKPHVKAAWLTEEQAGTKITRDATSFVAELVAGVNAAWWRLALDGFTLRLLVYSPKGFAPEHHDLHPGWMTQKLAVSVVLNEGYEGGDLQVRVPDARGVDGFESTPRTPGTVVAYPGWTRHRVTPIVDGTRVALVAFAYGPQIR